jgi:hypothetical protein
MNLAQQWSILPTFVCALQVPEPASSWASPTAAHSADRHQRSSLLRAAHLHRIRAKAKDESHKVDEVSFINNLTNAGKKADLQQRLEEGEGDHGRGSLGGGRFVKTGPARTHTFWLCCLQPVQRRV